VNACAARISYGPVKVCCYNVKIYWSANTVVLLSDLANEQPGTVTYWKSTDFKSGEPGKYFNIVSRVKIIFYKLNVLSRATSL